MTVSATAGRTWAGSLCLAALCACTPGAAPPPPPAAEAAAPAAFDEASETGLTFVHTNGASPSLYMPEIVGAGGALFDFDDDGDLDALLVQGAPVEACGGAAPGGGARLFRNDVVPGGRLSFVDVTQESGIDARACGMGVATGDYDNDGRIDVYLTNYGPNQLWHNEGGGRFTDATARAGVEDDRWSVSAAFVDYDRDGGLDLFVTGYLDFRVSNHRDCKSKTGRPDYCGPTSYDGLPDRLFRNRGDGRFEDVTGRAGLLRTAGPGLGVVAADFDGDGWPDIYVANDRQPNFLWSNRGDGTFTNEAMLAGAAVNADGQAEASMGLAAGDLDGDADPDLFMTHIDRETNTLYVNEGGLFADRTSGSRLGPPSLGFTGFGTAFLDYDNDGWLDVAVANGAVEAPERAGEPGAYGQRDQLLRNRGDGTFEDVSREAGTGFQVLDVGRGLAAGDIDNDGDADILVTNNDGPARLLLNRVGERRRWLGLRLRVAPGGRDALGGLAMLRLADGRELWRRVHSDGSYASASDPRLLFGLGADGEPVELRVTWPDGTQETWPVPPTGRYTTLVQGTGSVEP